MALGVKFAAPFLISSSRSVASKLPGSFRLTFGSNPPNLSAVARFTTVQSKSLVGGHLPSQASCCALVRASRRFADAKGSVDERVISAVKRYAAMRVEELKREDTMSGERDKMVQALSADVSTTTKWDELGFDDLDKVEVLLEVEEEFSLVIPDDTADSIQSVDEAIAYIQSTSS
eukprot:TRINITY_DN49034_c0_g1_i1.p1 TRINITY_DN49034_c0_g1~~TRINITY_DN49034_c0_g1_i1.p1  ORF type:complete len:175 (-),score=42.32 TRINITY_DN49034_c0_g1_i1:216-740(-)